MAGALFEELAACSGQNPIVRMGEFVKEVANATVGNIVRFF